VSVARKLGVSVMKTFVLAAFGALALGLTSAPAQAAMALKPTNLSCDLYSAAGCLFTYDNGSGNIFDDPDAFEGAYNSAHVEGPGPATIDMTYLGKQTPAQDGLLSMTFNSLPYQVAFYSVKAGSGQVLLFGLTNPTNSFTALQNGIYNKDSGPGRNLKGISHVTFYGASAPVPEPATWAMMIMGFGAAGAILRRRRTALA